MKVSLLSILMLSIAVLLLMNLPLGTYFDAELIQASVSAGVIRVPIAIASLLVTLRMLDWMAGISFSGSWKTMSQPHAIYLAGRIIGVTWLLAAILG